MRLRQLLILLSSLLLSTAWACAEFPTPMALPQPQVSASPTASPPRHPVHRATPLQIAPEALVAQLNATADLQTAAAQVAALLQIPLDQIQVRIRSKACTVCNLAEQGAESQSPLLSVAEAEAQLQPYDLLWLSVQPLTCAYYFDGKTIKPRSCQIE